MVGTLKTQLIYAVTKMDSAVVIQLALDYEASNWQFGAKRLQNNLDHSCPGRKRKFIVTNFPHNAVKCELPPHPLLKICPL